MMAGGSASEAMTILLDHRGTPKRLLLAVARQAARRVCSRIEKNRELTLLPSRTLQTFPALFGLYNNGFLPKGIHIVGYARTKMDEEAS